ncbi:DUF1272 domain-containing protein [Thalassotalea agarivorans]
MKTECQQSQATTLENGEAYICSYECTFCTPCAVSFDYICPNCQGELVPRPKRAAQPSS